MKLSELLRAECVRAGSSADDKALALCEIAGLARKSSICRNVSEEDILEALQDRETLGATALGNGIAIPHCRMRGIHDFVVGLMTVPGGVDFEAEDGKKVRLLVFIIAPHDQSDTHIRLLSVLSQTLQDPDAVTRMIAARSKKHLAEIFVEAASQEIQAIEPAKRNLVHIFVQDEKVFKNILDAISSLESISLTICEAANARSYLTRIPLYAEFADNGKPKTGKVIAASVERQLSNEVIRRIESITGSLFECTGIMVTVQELSYCAGALEM
jgi:mannitol/fructose-specific phosphotransferase system IIA component (Ntr-type)